jgi:hypothetical protein
MKPNFNKIIKQILKEEIQKESDIQRSILIIYKYPGLKDILVKLMSEAYLRFLNKVELIAPKPTTFNVELRNNLQFYLTYMGDSEYMVKISGKKYVLNSLKNTQRAQEAITKLLTLSPAVEDELLEDLPPSPDFDPDEFSGSGIENPAGDALPDEDINPEDFEL